MIKKWIPIILTAVITSVTTLTVTLLNTKTSYVVEQARMVPDLLTKISQLQTELTQLYISKDINATAAVSFFEHMPFPAWLKIKKEDKFYMYQINDAYSHEWDISQLQYEGKYDEAVWGDHVAKGFASEDNDVLTNLKSIVKWRLVPVDPNKPDGEKTLWIISKFPVRIFTKVDFPCPFCPTKAIFSPLVTFKFTSSNTSFNP